MSQETSVSITSTDAFQLEKTHLDDVLQNIRQQLLSMGALERYVQEDTTEAQTADEVATAAVERLREEQIRSLHVAKSEPYFGRFDFKEANTMNATKLYIGKRGVNDSASGDRLVVDWRAPIASMFYSFSGKGNQAEYDALDGRISGTVALKRNIVIRDALLQRVVDSYVDGQENLNVTDEFLLYRLTENKDNRLRDIVSSIQAEQDLIIRANRQLAIVIQGVAGSGKTTVALHRLAFLLYQYSEKLRAERMVIFAPNAMFVDYISDVLPELGVGNIQQTTFSAWALNVLAHQVALKNPADRLERWFGVTRDDALEHEIRLTQYKGSREFMQHLDDYLEKMEQQLIPNNDFEPWDGARLAASTIQEWFINDYANYSILSRIDRVQARMKRWYEIELKNLLAGTKDPRKKLAADRFRAYKKRFPAPSPLSVYQAVIAAGLPMATPFVGDPITKHRGARPGVDTEDLAPLVYIAMRLQGIDRRDTFDHVVIDEAQDFSPLQIAILQAYCPSKAFTILGDLSQSIHAYQGITEWDSFLSLFPSDARQYYQLDISYRSTTEIIEFANQIISHFPSFTLAQPVFRSGDAVLMEYVTEGQRGKQAAQAIKELAKDANTLALVTRTEADAIFYHQVLQQDGMDVHLITASNQSYAGGISVLPAYLTKGLEFDAVLLVDVTAQNYTETPESAKLLYVGCTRALHQLVVHYSGQPSPLLPKQ